MTSPRVATFLYFGIAVSCGVQALHAAYPLVVDDAAIHPPRETEFDLSMDVQRDATTESAATNVSLTAGLLSRLEGSVSFGYGWQRDRHAPARDERDGILDLGLGAKVPLMERPSAPFALTLSSTIVIPTASSGLGVDSTNLNLLAIATREWGDLNVDFNAGYNWAPADGASRGSEDAAFIGAAARWNATGEWMLFIETFALLPTHPTEHSHSILRWGCQVEVAAGIFLGGAFAVGYGGSEHLGTSLGLTWVF